MNWKNEEYISSQKSPGVYCIQAGGDVKGTNQHMFVEDFCRSPSISLDPHPFEQNRDFYHIEPHNDTLRKLLCFNKFSFLEHDLDKLLSRILHKLIFSGIAYVEIVNQRDKNGIVKGISFVPISPIVKIKGREQTLFVSVSFDKKLKIYCIGNDNLVVLRLKDLGFSRFEFRRLMRRLKKLDLTDVSDFSLDSKKLGFDFNQYIHKTEFNLLKVTKQVYWYGRNGNNQHLSESYLLYRVAKFKMLQKSFLDYMLKKINSGLEIHKAEFGFNGKIVADCDSVDYMKEFERLWAGEINTSQLSKQVFRV